MASLNPWTVALVTTVAAMLLRSGFRRSGWGRFGYIMLAIAVLLLGFWYLVVQAGKRIQSQENAAVGKIWQGTSAAPNSGPVRWHGQVIISSSGGLNLDQVPPNPGRSPDLKLGTAPDQIQGAVYGGEGNLASWNSRGTPGSLDCLNQIAAVPQLRLTVRSGSTVCLQTAAGRIAALTFTRVNADHGPDSAEVTIWPGG